MKKADNGEKPNHEINITIPDSMWEEIGTEKPKSRLLTNIKINGLNMHVEAFQIKKRTHENGWEPLESADGSSETIELFHRAAGSDGEFSTVKIKGSEYIIVVYPYDA